MRRVLADHDERPTDVTGPFTPDPNATIGDLRRARDRERLWRTELDRVRTAALAWRNGMAALLAGLVGFGLLKGRSDVGALSPGWATTVGLLLAVALIVGAVAAGSLMTAAHGLPAAGRTADLPSQTAADHAEALLSARRLRRGITLTAVFVLVLTTAVAVTWYGPEKTKPALRVKTTTADLCGTLLRTRTGQLTLTNDKKELTLPPTEILSVSPADKC
ncbi:hypothetical protein AB0H37_34910 [Actinomadura sp. NPDC023710]|uniref:hypothetical protein n=1 Tax=Actinomadura sp. NPDC023710 TaxID=3158219 RepID=UPI0033FD75BD